MLRDAVWFWNKTPECRVLSAKFSLKMTFLIFLLLGEWAAGASPVFLQLWFHKCKEVLPIQRLKHPKRERMFLSSATPFFFFSNFHDDKTKSRKLLCLWKELTFLRVAAYFTWGVCPTHSVKC